MLICRTVCQFVCGFVVVEHQHCTVDALLLRGCSNCYTLNLSGGENGDTVIYLYIIVTYSFFFIIFYMMLYDVKCICLSVKWFPHAFMAQPGLRMC